MRQRICSGGTLSTLSVSDPPPQAFSTPAVPGLQADVTHFWILSKAVQGGQGGKPHAGRALSKAVQREQAQTLHPRGALDRAVVRAQLEMQRARRALSKAVQRGQAQMLHPQGAFDRAVVLVQADMLHFRRVLSTPAVPVEASQSSPEILKSCFGPPLLTASDP